MKDKADELQLQVLICTFGRDGIERVASGMHPEVAGVQYLVSWQASDGIEIPQSLFRHDFIIHRTGTIGLSKNRNNALAHATAPLLLISDDDVDYTLEGLTAVISSFQKFPDIDIFTFRYVSKTHQKNYPDIQFSIDNPLKGYFVTSFEIAMRRNSIVGNVWFNENFGIGATFPSGEEDVFIRDCLDNGLKGLFIPVTIARHDGPTTSEKNLMLSSRPRTKGAVFNRLHPHSWPLRMLAHALREIPLWKDGKVPSPLKYCHNWIKGSLQARKMKVFPTPDYSSKYMS